MYRLFIGSWIAAFAFCAFLISTAQAEPATLGNQVCLECHKAEHEIWSVTKHFKSFRTVHKSKKAKGILKAVGSKSMKKTETCTLCHYTMVSKKAGKKARAKSGPSCESCHGAASDWIEIHNDFGGKNVKKADETAAHKSERIAKSKQAGMIWSGDHYGIAENCMGCHGLSRADVDGKILAAMLNADHPLNPDFELVRYSQGSVRHRFYAPDVTTNAEMSVADLARLFVEGQAAKLVSAAGALTKSDDAKYQAVQKKRVESASAALGAVTSVPEAAALIAAPNRDNALNLVAAIAGKDLSGEVARLLPDKGSYK